MKYKNFILKDVALIAAIVLLGLIIWAVSWMTASAEASKIYAEITSADGVITVSLNENQIFSVDERVVFEIKDGQIAFIESDCPNQICVGTGFLGRSGQMAACLPNNILLFIVSPEVDDTIDIFIR